MKTPQINSETKSYSATLMAGTDLDVTFPSGVTAIVTFNRTYYGPDPDDAVFAVYYTSGFAAGTTEPICDPDDAAFIDSKFLAGATVCPLLTTP